MVHNEEWLLPVKKELSILVCLLCLLGVNLVKRIRSSWQFTCVNLDISSVLEDEALSSENCADVATPLRVVEP